MEAGTPAGSVATALEGSSPPLMSVGLYADVHVPGPAIQQLRRRGVDVLAATEAGTHEMPDHELLALATSLQRVMVTHRISGFACWRRIGSERDGGLLAWCLPTSTGSASAS